MATTLQKRTTTVVIFLADRFRMYCEYFLLGLTTDSSSGPRPNKADNDIAIGHGCFARLSLRLTPPIFPEDAAETFLVVVPPAVEINFPVESLLKHLKNVVSML